MWFVDVLKFSGASSECEGAKHLFIHQIFSVDKHEERGLAFVSLIAQRRQHFPTLLKATTYTLKLERKRRKIKVLFMLFIMKADVNIFQAICCSDLWPSFWCINASVLWPMLIHYSPSQAITDEMSYSICSSNRCQKASKWLASPPGVDDES